MTGIQYIGEKYFDIKSWITWCGQFLQLFRRGHVDDDTSEMVVTGSDTKKVGDFGCNMQKNYIKFTSRKVNM